METFIPVLLAEEEPDTISVVTLFLAELKQIQLSIASSAEEALLKFSENPATLVLYADGLQGADSLQTLKRIHQRSPSTYIIVSTSSNPARARELLSVGATDCVVRDAQHVSNLVKAVRKGLGRIAERKSFSIAPMPRADQFVLDENLPDLIFYLNPAGKILYANRAIQTILGFGQRAVVNRSFEDLIYHQQQRERFLKFLTGKDSHPGFRQVLCLACATGKFKEFDVDLVMREGDLFYGVARLLHAEDPSKHVPSEQPTADAHGELPVRIGPYRVLTLLGAGSMGRVYKGFDEQLERYVAIKVIAKKFAAAKDYVERFHHEAKLLASLTHPNIALIYFFGVLEGLPYFCMEYMSGGSLETYLRQHKTLHIEGAVSHTMQVAIGLSKALEKGVVHLDVKPSNLMIAENDRIKIVDFGLARTMHQLQNIPSHIIGTPLYVAPEQIRGGMVDFRCDIFSLGITFFQMLYGFVPHSAEKVQEVFRKRVKGSIPSRSQLDSSVPERLYEIVSRMTRNDPAERYGSYAELIADLEAVRRGKSSTVEEVAMSPPPAGSAVYMRGLLYDRPFAEVLGHIASAKLSGKLTLSWFDLVKNLHFKNGEIVAVLSNQEGENFIDLLVKQGNLTGDRFRHGFASSDLFSNFSSAMSGFTADTKNKLTGELQDLAWRILQGLFSWLVGEFLFEEGNFPGQAGMSIRTGDVLVTGVRGWMDFPTIYRRLNAGHCRIQLNPEFQKTLPVLNVGPADAFLLFRFENSILFHDLLDLSGISDDEFFRLIYLYSAVGIVRVEGISDQRPSRPVRKVVSQPEPILQQTVVEDPSAVTNFPQENATAKKEAPPSEAAPAAARQVVDLPLYYYQCAINSFNSRNYWATVEYCKKALELREEGRIYRLMGNALATHHAFHHEAMEAYKKALVKDPKSHVIERDIGDLYFVTRNYALARSHYQKVLKKNPDDAHSRSRLDEISRLKK